MRTRSRSIRFKIFSLLLVPIPSLIALWAFAAKVTLDQEFNLIKVHTLDTKLATPTDTLITDLQQERRLSLMFLGSGRTMNRVALDAQRMATDQAKARFVRSAQSSSVQDAANVTLKQRISQVVGDLDGLDGIRSSIDSGGFDRSQALESFDQIVGEVFGLYDAMSTLDDSGVAAHSRAFVALSRAREVLTQEDALLSGVLAARRLSASDHDQFAQLVGTQRFLYADAFNSLPTPERARYEQFTTDAAFTRFQSLEDRVIARSRIGAPPPVTARQWNSAVDSAISTMRGLEQSVSNTAADRSTPVVNRALLNLAVAGGLGLLAVIASIVIAIRIGRRLIGEARELTEGVLDFAHRRLPLITERLRKGEQVDGDTLGRTYDFGTEEILKLAEAFIVARRATVTATANEATLRRSVNDIFLNLARRNQALVHRQLSLLDAMERRVIEPDELEDLFRLDHLATRMRRHAEGLIILAGAAPGRGWRHPVPLIDVVRGAVAEVEDYARVTVLPMPEASLAGPAVADVIHLIAELVENATLYSPPHTPVQVTGQLVANGFVIEIEDRGLSMSPEELAAANERLENPPEFDLSDSARLGLFVVGRLAQRHDIKVSLRVSPYGGTTAVVLLPSAIVVPARSTRRAVTRDARSAAGDNSLTPVAADGSPIDLAALLAAETESGDEPGRQAPLRLYRDGAPDPETPALPRRTKTETPDGIREPAAGPAPAPRPGQQPADRPVPPAQRVDGSGTANGNGRPASNGTGHPPLPRRVRQANLAPQLRDDPVMSEGEPVDSHTDRSPEDIRTMMTALQQGWSRGRSEGEQAEARISPAGPTVQLAEEEDS